MRYGRVLGSSSSACVLIDSVESGRARGLILLVLFLLLIEKGKKKRSTVGVVLPVNERGNENACGL